MLSVPSCMVGCSTDDVPSLLMKLLPDSLNLSAASSRLSFASLYCGLIVGVGPSINRLDVILPLSTGG